MTDYTQQLEEENERLKQKLDETVAKYDDLYNNKDNLRERIREIDIEKYAQPIGVPAKYAGISPEALQDFQNMHGVFSYKTIAKSLGIDEAEIDKLMKEHFNAE